MPNLKVTRLKRPKTYLREVTNIYSFAILTGYIFASSQQITFKLGNCANFKVLFSVESTNFPLNLSMSKVEKQKNNNNNNKKQRERVFGFASL